MGESYSVLIPCDHPSHLEAGACFELHFSPCHDNKRKIISKSTQCPNEAKMFRQDGA